MHLLSALPLGLLMLPSPAGWFYVLTLALKSPTHIIPAVLPHCNYMLFTHACMSSRQSTYAAIVLGA